MPEVVVVPLPAADAGEVLTLQRAAYVAEARRCGDVELAPLTQTLDDLRAELAAGPACGAVVAGRLVGSVRGRVADGVLHVARLAVAPDRQRRGTGGRLLAAVEAAAPGAHTAALLTGQLSDDDLRLYARHGYVEHAREQVRPGLVLVHLRKRLRHAAPDGEGPPPPVERQLRALEESLWRGATRFDRAHVDGVLAADFAETGRSGRRWTRDQVLDAPPVDLRADLPLPGFAVRLLAPGVALVTYRSVVRVGGAAPEESHRSSLWAAEDGGWRLVHHQGTPAAGAG